MMCVPLLSAIHMQIPLNETVSEVTLHISVETIHALKFAFFTQASAGWRGYLCW